MFGEIVRSHRRRLGLSQEDLFQQTGVGVRSIGKIENGRIAAPRPVTVRLLADAFGLTGPDRDDFCRAAVTTPPPARAPGPAQLPADVIGFVGRTEPLRQLTALLAHDPDEPATSSVIATIAGTVGVGKTTLATHWGHQVRDRFPDGQLYVNLRGFDSAGPAVDPAQAIRGFLDALDVPPPRMPTQLQDRAALYRTLLTGRRMLIMLDNARDAEQVRPLLPGAPGCLVVITSRHRLSSLVAVDSAHPIVLDLLTPGESRQFLAARLGPERVGAERDPVDEIISYSARLPLALAIVAARASAHPDFPLRTFAAELRDSRDRLDALAAGEDPATDVRAVFSWSYRTLSEEAARLFRLLGVHPGPDISAPAAASLAGVPLRQARRLLAELAGVHLIGEYAPGRYAFHDLLRAYALERATSTESPTECRGAVHRVLDHYLLTGYEAALLLTPARDPIAVAPAQPGVTPEVPVGHEPAMEWFAAEHAVLLAAIDAAVRAGLDVHAWQLAWTLIHYLDRRGHWHDWATTQDAALAAARRLRDPAAEALAHRLRAIASIQLGQYENAHEHLEQALDLYHRIGDPQGQGHTQIHLGLALVRVGDNAGALEHTKRSLPLFEAAGHRAGVVLARNGVGWLQAQLGDYEQALASCLQALTLAQQLGSVDEEAATWDSLGYVYHHLGRPDEAADCYQRALALKRTAGDRHSEAGTLAGLAELQHARGDLEGAREAWREALAVLEDLNHPDADELRGRLGGPGL